MKKLLVEAGRMGSLLASRRAIFTRLALEAAEAAARGEIDEDDAVAVYHQEYLRKRQQVTSPDLSPLTVQVQISKLRQIIKLGNNYKRAPELLYKVMTIYEDLVSQGIRTISCYEAMVGVARAKLSNAHVPGRNEIEKILRTHKRKVTRK